MVTFEQQERWYRARQRRSLDPAKEGFGVTGLLARLDGPGIFITVIPADDLAQPIDFTDDLPGQILPDRFTGATAGGVAFLPRIVITSTALVRCDSHANSDMSWRAFLALDRCGGVQGAIGKTARYRSESAHDDTPSPVLRLFVLVHLARVVVGSQTRMIDWANETTPRTSIDGPFEVVVALPETTGMALGGLNEGWEPPDLAFDPPRASEENVMVRVQVEEWPTQASDCERLALRIVDRTCEAFGDRQQRYFRRGVQGAGTLGPDYA